MRGVTPTGAKRKPKRLLTWSATRVADLIHRRGALLRVALGKPLAAAALPSAPSMIEENAALTATIALRDQKIDALERELQVCRPERANFADRHQKALKRAARKRAARNELKEAQQRGYSEAQKAARAAQLATRKRNFDAAVERASYVRVVMLTKKLERANKKLADAGLAHVAALEEKAKQVSTARKRARKVENAAKKLDATQETLKAAKAEAKELRARCESESESESDEEEGGGAAQQRRNQRGRFQAGDWRQRLTALAPDVVYHEPAARQMRARRMELTIAGECINYVRVAKAKRVVSFGIDESSKFGLGVVSTNTQIEEHGAAAGETVDVVMRGAVLSAGSKSRTGERILRAGRRSTMPSSAPAAGSRTAGRRPTRWACTASPNTPSSRATPATVRRSSSSSWWRRRSRRAGRRSARPPGRGWTRRSETPRSSRTSGAAGSTSATSSLTRSR